MKRLWILMLVVGAALTACGTESSHSNDNHSTMEMDHGNHQTDASTTEETDHSAHGAQEGTALQSDQVKVEWSFADGNKLQAKQAAAIRMTIAENGDPIEKFDINHEKLLHLIIVSKDLSYFNHIHPEYSGAGVFEITNSFPAGGDYKLIADFVPTGGEAMSRMEWVHVEGESQKDEPIVADTSLTAVVDGKQIALSIDALAPNKEVMLTYSVHDEQTGQPISNLQPYLGAVGHVVILTKDTEQYLHVHPMEEQAAGPTAEFMTTFPSSGIYKIWGQFKHNDQVFTVPFVVEVP